MRGIQFGEQPYLQEAGKVSSCAYSPDSKSLALGLSIGSLTVGFWSSRRDPLTNGIIRLYSTSSWELVRTFTGHRNAVNCIVFSPRGDRIMSCSSDNTARLWDVESGTCIRILSDHVDSVNSVAFSPLGDTVASASSDRTARVWDVETGECRLTLNSQNREFGSVVYSPMGDRIVLGERMSSVSSLVIRRCAVRVLDVDAGKSLHDLSGHGGSIWGVAYSPRGGRIASGSADSTVRIWDVESGACCRVLTDHGGEVHSVAFSFQGDMIVSAGEDKTVRIWDAESGTCHQIFTGHSRSVRCVVFSPRGDYIASGSDDETARLWDVGSGGTRQVTIGHSKKVLSVVYSPHGNQVVSCGDDGSIKFWDAESGVCRRTITSYLYSVASIAYPLRGDLVITGVFERRKMEQELLNLFGQCFIQYGTEGPIVFSYSLEGDQGASEDSDGWTRIGDVISSEHHYTLPDRSEKVIDIVNSPQGIYIASSNKLGTVNIRDIESGAQVCTLDGHSRFVKSVVYSPRGDWIASVGYIYDSSVKLWDVETGDCRRILIGHITWVCVVVFSPQGDQVASGCHYGQVKIWDVGTGERLFMFTGHTENVTSLTYSPKGDRIISGSDDKTFRLWDLSSGQCRAVVQELKSPIERIAWGTTSDATCFVTGCTDGSVCMWQVMEEGDTCQIHWRWRSISGELNLTDVTIQDVRGLSQVNKQLLKQRGALGEPFDRLREAGQTVLSTASVISALKQSSIGMVLEASSALSSVAEQSEQPESSGEQN
ncbi:MAG: quinon protein alcohol dehydrogenase-like superfamily [Benniella sp.]|nr:MAG: quinon protein alcohol dehydrogenase-like superfamily [Benniella sp.]